MQNSKLPNATSIRLDEDVKIWIIQKANEEGRTIARQINYILKQIKEGKIKSPA